MRIALTGTPCVGKTTLGQHLRQRGDHVIDLKQWAASAEAVSGTDPDGTQIIDVDTLPLDELPMDCFIEGHMAHHLDVDAIWLVRCDPRILQPRLAARGYSAAKVQENLEAEAMDLILQECLDLHPIVVQRDGTQRSPGELMASFDGAETDTLKAADLEPVDWSAWLMEET